MANAQEAEFESQYDVSGLYANISTRPLAVLRGVGND